MKSTDGSIRLDTQANPGPKIKSLKFNQLETDMKITLNVNRGQL